MAEDRTSPSIGALQLKKKISFAWALSAVVAAIFVAAHQTGVVLPVPFLALLVTVGLSGGFGGLISGVIGGVFMSLSIIYAWVLGFGPATLTGSIPNVVIGCAVAIGFGGFLGAMRDQIVDLVVEIDERRRELDDLNRQLEQRVSRQSEELRKRPRP